MIKFSFPKIEIKIKVEQHIEKILKNLFRQLWDDIMFYSPVWTGSYRASMRLSFNIPDITYTLHHDPKNPLPRATFQWPSGFELGDKIYLSNSVPHAQEVEFGWPTKAGYAPFLLSLGNLRIP